MIPNSKWHEVKEIFYAALRYPPDERKQFLDEACQDDDQLRREVESLLSSADSAGSFMQHPAVGEVAEAIAGNKEKLRVSQSLSHYKILRLIGEGGMGEVYLAEDTTLNRPVALKVLRAEIAHDQNRVGRFIQEAKSASALNHPNILTVYEVGSFEGARYIVSEFIKGVTLRERLGDKPLAPHDALDVAAQVAAALNAAHKAGIVHRDIKPENIMVRDDGLVKVLDFGLAKLTEKRNEAAESDAATQALVKTVPGMIMGTIAYMSPEQARGQATDARTDVWSLGVVLYEMLAGRQPFAGETMSDKIAAILKSEPAPLTQNVSEVPQELERIVGRTLRKNADERYQHIKDLLIDLGDLKQELEFAANLERRTAPTKVPTKAPTTATANKSVALTMTQSAQTTSREEYFAGGIKNHRLASIATLLVLTIGIVALYYFTRGDVSHKQTSDAPIDSIAVLPFSNAAKDPDAEYLSDGITESLINRLSQVSGLKVMSSSSVLHYKGKEQDARKVGHELNVRAVLTGSVRQLGNQLVIAISLDDAKDSHHIWGEQYPRKFADILAVQNEIAREVSRNLQLKLTSTDERQIAKRDTENVEAYQLYLKGLYEWNKFTQENLQKAIEYFNQALEKDPNYALAYFGLAASYGRLANNYLPPNEAFPKAKVYAAKALAIDDTLAEAHTALGAVKTYYDWDWAEAENELKRALTLNPNNAETYNIYSDYLDAMGRFDESQLERKHAQELDPLLPSYQTNLGTTLYFAGQYNEAIVQIEKAIYLEPRYREAYLYLGQAYEQKKMYEQAIATYQKGMTQAERHPQLIAALGHAYALSGKRDKAQQSLDELREMSKQRYISPYSFAVVYAGLGDQDRTFAWLNKAYQDRSLFLIWLKVEPLFDSLHDDSRFHELVRRIGLK